MVHVKIQPLAVLQQTSCNILRSTLWLEFIMFYVSARDSSNELECICVYRVTWEVGRKKIYKYIIVWHVEDKQQKI